MKAYKTIKDTCSSEIILKKSQFIATICNVTTEQGAMNFINDIRKKYYDARHNVYAFNLKENSIRRYSDDKEPKGTAGVPVLNAILNEELLDVCVVVTRYFGGTLLGSGGLVRAYGSATSTVIHNSSIITMDTYTYIDLFFDYNLLKKLQNSFFNYKMKVLNVNYTDIVELNIIIKSEQSQNFCNNIIDICNGHIAIKEGMQVFYCL